MVDTTCVKTLHGFSLDVPQSPNWHRELRTAKTHHPAVVAFMESRLAGGGTFIDVGANIGFFTLLAARIVGPEGDVYAYEPHPGCFDILTGNMVDHDNTHLYRLALGAAPEAQRVLYEAGGSNASFVETRSSARRWTVEVETLDRQHIPYVDMLKIDVEGWEWHVLTGGEQLLREHKPLLCVEDNTDRPARRADAKKVIPFLRGLGYSVERIGRNLFCDP